MELKLKPGTWVVVCDGRKTIVLENIGDTVLSFTTVELKIGSANAPLPLAITPENG